MKIKQWRAILFIIGLIGIGYSLQKWDMLSFIIGVSALLIAATMKNK
ncbi:hypothetical protein LNP18_06150 [Leuconostoc citreum]|nr:hypothetical protein [Leuconostoc citreum]MCK8605684.1 hypothetical protein [Leuconostoc citreum]